MADDPSLGAVANAVRRELAVAYCMGFEVDCVRVSPRAAIAGVITTVPADEPGRVEIPLHPEDYAALMADLAAIPWVDVTGPVTMFCGARVEHAAPTPG